MKKSYLLVLVLCISFFACKEDSNLFILDDTDTINYIGGKFGGVVTDEFNSPIANAHVTIGDQSTSTDANGVFFIKHIAVDEKRAFLEIEKSDFFKGYKAFVPSATGISNLKIKLLSKANIGSFDASEGGNIELSGGGRLIIEPNSLVLQSGIPYTGDVQVAGRYLNPLSNDIGEKMPGQLRGINLNDESVVLQNYGMMTVQLFTNNGQILQLGTAKRATLHFPIPPELQNSAPADIDMWYFDAANGLWQKKRNAEQSDNNFIGEIDRFSFWSCNIAFPIIEFQSSIKDQAGNPLSNFTSQILYTESMIATNVQSSSNGEFADGIPAEELLTLQVISPCGETIITAPIGPFNSNINLEAFSVEIQSQGINGILTDCENEPISDGYVQLNNNGIKYLFFPGNDGQFTGTIPTCGSESLVLTGYDIHNNKQSAPNIIDINQATSIELNTCDAMGEFIIYQVNGNSFMNYQASLIQDSFGQTSLFSEDTQNGECSFSFAGIDTGIFGFEAFFNFNGLTAQQGSTPDLNVTVTYYGEIGDFVIGTFDGSFVSPTGETHQVNGNFKIYRDN